MFKILRGLLVIVAVAAAASYGTYAYFRSAATSNANTVDTGTLNVSVNDNGGGEKFDIDLGQLKNLAPGDHSGEAKIKVRNNGSINAATFGKFTLGNDPVGLASKIKFYNYKVEYFDASGNAKHRWSSTDPYFGIAANQDWFIKDGDDSKWKNVGGSATLESWVKGNGPLDIPGAAWDEEGLKPGEYYIITFQFQLDPSADNTYQGQHMDFGYEVRATQVNKEAIKDLGLGGNIDSAIDEHYNYLFNQVSN